MIDRKFKFSNDGEFITELSHLNKKYNTSTMRNFAKGKQMIIETLQEIYEVVLSNSNLKYNQESYSNLLLYHEFIGGKEFLETQEGKDIIEVFFYFAYKWKVK